LVNRLLLRLLDLNYYIDYSIKGVLINNVTDPQRGGFSFRAI